jgi:hypothetical protein
MPKIGDVQLDRTPRMTDPTREQILAGSLLGNWLAYVCEDDELDASSFPRALTGSFQVYGFGSTFSTRGRHPAEDGSKAKHPSRAKEAAGEAAEHMVFHVFGVLLGRALLSAFGRGKTDFEIANKIGQQMLSHPASFAVPWPALVGAEYGEPVVIDRGTFDPLVLTEAQGDETRARTIFISRPPGATAPAPSVEELFARRASYERFTAALASLEDARAEAGLAPLTSFELSTISYRWFHADSDASEAEQQRFANAVGVGWSFDELVARGEQATYELGARSWNFGGAVLPASIAPWPELL